MRPIVLPLGERRRRRVRRRPSRRWAAPSPRIVAPGRRSSDAPRPTACSAPRRTGAGPALARRGRRASANRRCRRAPGWGQGRRTAPCGCRRGAGHRPRPPRRLARPCGTPPRPGRARAPAPGAGAVRYRDIGAWRPGRVSVMDKSAIRPAFRPIEATISPALRPLAGQSPSVRILTPRHPKTRLGCKRGRFRAQVGFVRVLAVSIGGRGAAGPRRP